MTFNGLIDRLLKKRPIMFCDAVDNFFIANGYTSKGGFDSIGQPNESRILPIKDYMTYDEIKLAALVSASSKSIFINNGAQLNQGILGIKGSYEEDGIIIGLVGARFQRIGKMEFIDCAITKDQNIHKNGYGSCNDPRHIMLKEWAKLWKLDYLPTWAEVVDSKYNSQYIKLSNNMFLNTHVYKERIKITALIMIAEAAQRSIAQNKKAYIHVVGLGLRVWIIDKCQNQLFVDAWGEVLKTMDSEVIRNIECINFGSIPVDNCIGVKCKEKFPGTDITIYFSKREIHDPVPDTNLLICNYSWDGNSLPGNEYWTGSLTSSSDSRAASSSCITELHNHMINRLITSDNLHIVTLGKVKHISEYAKEKLKV